jgi:hypothetical protein
MKPFRPKFTDETQFGYFEVCLCDLTKMALKYLEIQAYCQDYSDKFLWSKFVQNSRIKVCPKTFRPKKSFVESTPAAANTFFLMA